ncbi:hypothetical protein BH10ACT1_BH10ACT1_02350 [soil metagenome]
MNAKLKTAVAVAALVMLTGSVAVAQTSDGGPVTKTAPPAGGTRAVGPDSYFIPITPCRIVDTRSDTGGGPFAPNDADSFYAYDTSAPYYKNQGGSTSACGISTSSVAIEVTVTAVNPSANGYFRAWPTGSGMPNATFLNYTKGQSISNTGTIAVGPSGPDLQVKNFGGTVDYVLDVQGYYEPFLN